MKAIDRKDYAPRYAYHDEPQSIGFGATISAPHMHGYALEKMQDFLKPGMRALDVGSGSGYLTACMANMVGPEGRVIGIEHIQELVDISERNVKKHHKDWMVAGRVKFVAGDGRQGYPEDSPYDCIHVGAAASEKPTELLRQLKAPGLLFSPVGTASQSIMIYRKQEDGTVREEKWLGVMYVPLTDKKEQYEKGY
ncbi:protein-L-isoaspartate O-methyltransferase [Zychaea mexicana]|uniref:protein-L-isoaspartate O-methyltransferase n=1 Tax=Zychaea mexicana TaxID=64656 RepID=UPI0022FF4202|nr:protein-L-isoaspartate O-methyltransferase [Zychaea mexicana]KAI9487963.1 protein-L-isoaspartate O-methyltransferase [Zychaea mexicana]